MAFSANSNNGLVALLKLQETVTNGFLNVIAYITALLSANVKDSKAKILSQNYTHFYLVGNLLKLFYRINLQKYLTITGKNCYNQLKLLYCLSNERN